MKRFIARASNIGRLLSNDRTKKGIGKTAITELEKMCAFEKYGYQEHFSNKYTEKGINNEQLGIEIAKRQLGWFDVDPNAPKIRLFNDWLTGEPDVHTSTLGADIKCSFDWFTFPKLEVECPNKDYYYQMMAYMDLTDKKEWSLVYVLTDMPEQMIIDEARRLAWKMSSLPTYFKMAQEEIEQIAEDKIRAQYTFGQIPESKRVKEFIIKRDESVISEMKERIELLQTIYNQIYQAI
jgi:hypothetical protein